MAISRFILIIGAMKSGTTTLFKYLDQHPAIAGAAPKEPGFFAFDDIFARGRSWYEAQFDFDPAHHIWALDGSTDYSKAPFCGDVPARMASLPDAEYRLIYIIRHPLRRIESHAHHAQFKRRELGKLTSDRRDHGLDSGISPVSMAISHYAAQLDHYRPMFDDGRLLIVSLEELSADPRRTIRRVSDFLGLAPLPALAMPDSENRAARRRMRPEIWDRLRAIPGLARIVTALVPDPARRALDRALARPPRISGRFRLTPAEETKLIAELMPDLRRLRDVYGFDVEGQWNIAIDPGPNVSRLPTSAALP